MKKYFLVATAVLTLGVTAVNTNTVSPIGNLFVSTVKADEQTLSADANYYIVLPEGHEEFQHYQGTPEKPVIGKTDKTPALYYIQDSHLNYIKGLNDEGKNFKEWKGTVDEFKAAISKLADKKVGDAEKTPAEQKPVEQKPEEQKPVEQKPEEQKPVEQKPEEQKPVEKKAEVKRTIPNTDLGVSAGIFALVGALGATVIGKKIKD